MKTTARDCCPEFAHTIRKYKKMAGQNTFQNLVLDDANRIGEH